MNVTLKHLQAFVAVAREGSFTRAAERLNLSQSAISRQMGALEEDLDGVADLRDVLERPDDVDVALALDLDASSVLGGDAVGGDELAMGLGEPIADGLRRGTEPGLRRHQATTRTLVGPGSKIAGIS